MHDKFSNKELEKIFFTQQLLSKSSIIQFIWKNEKDWPVEYVSENVEKVLLYSAKEFTSGKVLYSKIIHPEDYKSILNEIEKHITTKTNSFEHKSYRLIDKSGNIKWVKVITYVRRNKSNRITHFEGIVIDITKQKSFEKKLEFNNEFYKSILENSIDVINIINKSGDSLFISPSIKTVLGYSERDVIKKNIFNFIYKKDVNKVARLFEDVKSNPNKIYNICFRVYNSKGKVRFIEGTAINMLLSPVIKGILVNYRDISERKKIEQAIKSSEEKYKNIIENLTDVYYRANAEGRVTMVSPSAKDFFRCETIEEIIGFQIKKIYSKKKDRDEFVKRLRKNGSVKNYKATLIRNDNTEIYVETNAKVLLNKDGKYIGIEGIVRDITDSRKAENALKASYEKYQTVANYTYDWEYWIDANNNYAYVSPSAERITGYKPKDFYNDNKLMDRIIHPYDKELLKKHKEDFIKNGISSSIEYRIITKSKRVEWIGHVCQSVFDDNGKYLGIRGNNRLITKRKLAQEQLKKNEIELKKLNIAKDKFFSIIAHDLRSPFNSMFGFSELLVSNFDKYDTEKQKKYLNIIHDGIRSTYKLLDDLLLWSRSQQGIMDFTPENINLFLLTEDILEILYQTAEAKSISLINNIPENTNIIADTDMLSTIIRNLLVNSIKFTNKGGKIIINSKIITKNEYDYIQIEVIDNGIGIPKEKHAKLFDITENTSTKGTEDETGTGLGLILCKEFVEKHKGKIWFESEVDIGTTFYFTIRT